MNLYWFALLNAGPALGGWPLYFAIAAAEYLIYAVPVGLLAGWLWGSSRSRGMMLTATGAGLLALGINQLINLAWFHPRPFMMHVGHTYLSHAPDSSFPSDHVTLLWAMGLFFVMQVNTRFAGAGLLLLAMLAAWARIYLGVHFPLDMAGAVLVGTISALAFKPMRRLSDRHVLPLLEYVYRLVLSRPIARGWIRS